MDEKDYHCFFHFLNFAMFQTLFFDEFDEQNDTYFKDGCLFEDWYVDLSGYFLMLNLVTLNEKKHWW